MKPIKIGDLIITPKVFFGILFALFIIGLGIGSSVASGGESKFALLICAIISIAVIVRYLIKLKKEK
jgi:hypothetical protein